MANCFRCQRTNAENDVFIELPAPAPTIEPEEPDVVFQRNPSPMRRVNVKLCEECYSEVKKMPWTPWEV